MASKSSILFASSDNLDRSDATSSTLSTLTGFCYNNSKQLSRCCFKVGWVARPRSISMIFTGFSVQNVHIDRMQIMYLCDWETSVNLQKRFHLKVGQT